MDPIVLLLVEDDQLVRTMLEAALEEAGYSLVLAHNGDEAVAALEADARQFRAILTDIRLGAGPDGWEVARRARELVSDMPIVYMSGDSGPDWPSKGVPNSVVLSKPFALAQVITAVSTLVTELDARRAAANQLDGSHAHS